MLPTKKPHLRRDGASVQERDSLADSQLLATRRSNTVHGYLAVRSGRNHKVLRSAGDVHIILIKLQLCRCVCCHIDRPTLSDVVGSICDSDTNDTTCLIVRSDSDNLESTTGVGDRLRGVVSRCKRDAERR